MKLLFAICCALLLCSCDKEIKRTYGESFNITKETSCNYSGYCSSCGLNMNGKMDCGFRHSWTCPGDQMAEIKITPYTVTYESGTVKNYKKETVIKELTDCD